MADLGSKHLALDTGAAKACFAKVTVANVKKNLLAVSDLVKMGHEVVFKPGGAYMRHCKTGEKVPFKATAGTYEVDLEVVPFGRAPRAPPRPTE